MAGPPANMTTTPMVPPTLSPSVSPSVAATVLTPTPVNPTTLIPMVSDNDGKAPSVMPSYSVAPFSTGMPSSSVAPFVQNRTCEDNTECAALNLTGLCCESKLEILKKMLFVMIMM